MSPIISARNISKKYKLFNSKKDRLKEAFSLTGKQYHRDFNALEDINFELFRGDTLGVIGKNGSGKSTLLKIITGIIPPSSGSIQKVGNISALIELGAGFNPEFTGIDNVYFYGSILGFNREVIESKIDDILSFAGIGEFINQPVKTYSSGMKSRLAFAVAINADPEIFIVDEVLSVGDMFFKQKCMHRIRKMLDDGLTLFFVSHSIGEVKSLCRKALYLKNGMQAAFGDAEEVCNLYQNQSTRVSSHEREMAISNMIKSPKKTITEKLLQVHAQYSDIYCVNPHLHEHLSHRSGGGELVIESVLIVNEDGLRISTVESYQRVKIRVSFTIAHDISSGCAIGLLFRNSKGIDLFAINTDLVDIYLPDMKEGEKYVYEVLVTLPIVSGDYSISVGAKPNPASDYFYDRCFNACVFNVIRPQWQRIVGGVIYHYAESYKLLRCG